MAITFGAALGSNTNKTTGTTVTATTGAAVPVGATVIVVWAADNLSATTPTLSSVTDTKTNTYTVIANVGSGSATAAAGQVAAIAISKITTALTATDTISAVASSASTVVKAMDAAYFNGLGTRVRATTATATGSSTGPTVTYASGLNGDVVIGFIANQDNTQPTGDSDTTNGSWALLGGVSSTGGAGGTNISIYSQYKILTADGSQTYNVTITNGQWSIGAIAFVPAIQVTASNTGTGTQSNQQRETLKRQVTNAGVGTQTAVGARTIKTFQRTASNTGLGTQTVIGARKQSRTASNTGLGTQTVVSSFKKTRTASNTGLGTQSATFTKKPGRTASNTGLGTQTAVWVKNRKQRQALNSGTGTQNTVHRDKVPRTATSRKSNGDYAFYLTPGSLTSTSSVSSTGKRSGVSFTGNGRELSSVEVYLRADATLTSGTLTVSLYSFSGQENAPAGRLGYEGDLIAVSDTKSYSTLSTTGDWAIFNFSSINRVKLINGNKYVIVLSQTDLVGGSIRTYSAYGTANNATIYAFYQEYNESFIDYSSNKPVLSSSTTYGRGTLFRVKTANTISRVIKTSTAGSLSVTASDIGRGTSTVTRKYTHKRTAILGDGISDSPSFVNVVDFNTTTVGVNGGRGQTFFGNNQKLDSVSFYINGSPTSGYLMARLYPVNGTTTTFLPESQNVVSGYTSTSTPLAESDQVSYTSVPTSRNLVTFKFSGINKVTLNKQPYVLVMYNNTNASITMASSVTTPWFGHYKQFPGNQINFSNGGNFLINSTGYTAMKTTTTATVGRLNAKRTVSNTGTGTQAAIVYVSSIQRTASGSGLGTQTNTQKETLKRTVSNTGLGAQTVVKKVTKQRTVTNAGTGTQNAVRKITSKRTTTNVGTGTQTVTKLRKVLRTATASGLGTANNSIVHKLYRNAQGSGVATTSNTAVGRLTAKRTILNSGIGSQSVTKLITRKRTITNVGIGSQTIFKLHKVPRTTISAGTGSQTVIKNIPAVGINWSHWGTNALINSP